MIFHKQEIKRNSALQSFIHFRKAAQCTTCSSLTTTKRRLPKWGQVFHPERRLYHCMMAQEVVFLVSNSAPAFPREKLVSDVVVSDLTYPSTKRNKHKYATRHIIKRGETASSPDNLWREIALKNCTFAEKREKTQRAKVVFGMMQAVASSNCKMNCRKKVHKCQV